MPKVPQASDIQVGSFGLGSIAKIDPGVAAYTGQAGRAMGNAIESFGAAFAEVGARVNKAQSEQNFVELQLEHLNQADQQVKEMAETQSWNTQPDRFQKLYDAQKENPKYQGLQPLERSKFEVWRFRNDRPIAHQSASLYQKQQATAFDLQLDDYVTKFSDKFDSVKNPQITYLSKEIVDSKINEEANLLIKKVQSMGALYTSKQMKDKIDKIYGKAGDLMINWLQQNDPDTFQSLVDRIYSLKSSKQPTGSKPMHLLGAEDALRSRMESGPLFSINPKTPGLVEEGNIDLNARKVLREGNIYKTEESINIGVGDKQYLIPTVINGKKYSDEEAIKHFETTGEHLGVFQDEKSAEEYANKLHLRQEQFYKEKKDKRSDLGDRSPSQQTGSAVVPVGGSMMGKSILNPNDVPYDASGKNIANGSRSFGGPRKGMYHTAVDIPLKPGDPVLAAQDGRIRAIFKGKGYGYTVDVEYGKGSNKTVHRLAHLGTNGGGEKSAIPPGLKVGMLVKKGSVIGIGGYSGNAGPEFPHVHYEVIKGNAYDKGLASRGRASSIKELNAIRIDPRQWFAENDQPQSTNVASADGKMRLFSPEDAQAVQEANKFLPQIVDKYGEDIKYLAKEKPNTKIAQVVDPNDIEDLSSQFDGADIGSFTVGDLNNFINEYGQQDAQTPEEGDTSEDVQQSNIEDQSIVPVTTDIGSNLTSLAERNLKNLSKQQLWQLKQDFTARRKAATKISEGNAKQMMFNREQSILKNGTEPDPKDFDPDIVNKMFPVGRDERNTHEVKVQDNKNLYAVFSNYGDKPLEEIRSQLESRFQSLQTKEAQTYAESKYNKLSELFLKDPAQYVEDSKIVKHVRNSFQDGKPKTKAEKQKLIEARMAAQKNLGIPQTGLVAITDAEASVYASSLVNALPNEFKSVFDNVEKSVVENYGKEVSADVLRAVIRQYTQAGNNQNEAETAISRRLNAGEINSLYNPAYIEKQNKLLEKKPEPTAQKDLKPTIEDLRALNSGAMTRKDFMEKYNLSFIESAYYQYMVAPAK